MNEYGGDLDCPDTIEEILYEWETLEEERIYSTTRWSNLWGKVVRSPLGVPFRITWRAGATEYQDCDPKYTMVKVKPIQKTITTYVTDEG